MIQNGDFVKTAIINFSISISISKINTISAQVNENHCSDYKRLIPFKGDWSLFASGRPSPVAQCRLQCNLLSYIPSGRIGRLYTGINVLPPSRATTLPMVDSLIIEQLFYDMEII